MKLSLHSGLKWYTLVIAWLLFIFFCKVLWILIVEINFERSLNTLFVTFDDFEDVGPTYNQALRTAGKEPFDFAFPPLTNHSSSTIPPIIHFIWFKDLYQVRPHATTISHEGSNTPELCEKYNPTYTINIWNQSQARSLLEEHYAWFLPTYDDYRHPIQRVDAAKYFILWHYGGIYMDLDVSCRKGLDPLLKFPAWLPRASPLGVNNDLMASRAGHPLMWKMVDGLRRRDKNLLSPWVTIYWTTGPKFTSDMLQNFLSEHGIWGANRKDRGGGARFKRDSDANAVYVLPKPFYSEEYTFFGHREGGTWHGKDVAVVLWLIERSHIVLLGGTLMVVAVYLSLAKKSRVRLIRLLASTRRFVLDRRRGHVEHEEMSNV